MIKEEILKGVLEIAIANGFVWEYKSEDLVNGYNYYSLIFRHDFAKALWGEEESYTKMMEDLKKKGKKVDPSLLPNPIWKRNLEAMVLMEDKLEFLQKNIDFIKNKKENKETPESRREELMKNIKNMYGKVKTD